MEKCRFLSNQDICLIGQFALHELEHIDSNTTIIKEQFIKPCKAEVNPKIGKDYFTKQNYLMFVMDCTEAKNVQSQQLCDYFIPKHLKGNNEE